MADSSAFKSVVPSSLPDNFFSRIGEDSEITLVCNFEFPTLFDKEAYGTESLLSNYPTVTDYLQPYQFVVFKRVLAER